MVTTPQNVALSDARKAADMFDKVGIPVLGVVENMNSFACPKCGEVTSIFGKEGGEKYAGEKNTFFSDRPTLMTMSFLAGLPGSCECLSSDPSPSTPRSWSTPTRDSPSA